jgi:hypothetical protein
MGISGGGFNFEEQKMEDLKYLMLDQIEMLRTSLIDAGMDLTKVPEVTAESSFNDVEKVYKTLKYRNDRSRYTSFAEEFILFGAHAMGEVFDGKKTYFGRYSPDLTGWHNQVNTKLQRLRPDTTEIVSNIMHDFNIGSGARMILELVPNAVLYNKMRKEQRDSPSLYSDAHMAQANQRIRDLVSKN